MNKEKVMHVLSVLLDELTKGLWNDSVASWQLLGDDQPAVVLTLRVYEKHTVSLKPLTELIHRFEVSSFGVSFCTNDGILEIRIVLSDN